ncbi:hypothetical protein [Leptotrichia wadei]|uniref:Uncharacterized protein n=1 Tax=Leptotrichia wadei (strain F0279) TaxID=888055 RepID=U2PNZ8_LEPWF|nr:hypothetical protein [Leptotrichia wadei]ERK52270.1 hypothetical protein HMPREF9015_00837 [Leptotrichia wadei F0279]
MKLGKKEQVFKVHWVEELKILCRIVCVPAIIIYQGIIISSQFLTSKKEIFLGYFLIALLSIIAFIILSIYIFNKKVVISNGILTYYRGKKVWSRKIEKNKIKVFNGSSWFYENIKYLWIDCCNIPISLFGKENCSELEKIIYEFQLEKKEIEDTVFEIPKKELLLEKFKDIFKNNAIGVIFTLIIVKMLSSDFIFWKYFLIIITFGAIILEIISLIRMKICTPKIIKIFSNFISIDDEKYSKYDIKKVMITSPNTKSGTIDFGYRILKIFGNNEKKVYTLITSKNSEFKNEDYETFYGETVKFCIVNEIEYELV